MSVTRRSLFRSVLGAVALSFLPEILRPQLSMEPEPVDLRSIVIVGPREPDQVLEWARRRCRDAFADVDAEPWRFAQ